MQGANMTRQGERGDLQMQVSDHLHSMIQEQDKSFATVAEREIQSGEH